MEVRVRERLVGALVLVAIVVLLVPAVLKGPDRAPEATGGPVNRSVEVLLDDSDPPAQDEVLVPEPAAAQAKPTPPDPPPVQAAAKPAGSGESTAARPPAPVVAARPSQAPPAAGSESDRAIDTGSPNRY